MTDPDPRDLLKKHWGYDDFRKAQRAIIDPALAGEDVLGVLPTGYGKSCCFQIPAIAKPGTAIVVSPLIALMKDQTDDCLRRGIRASYVNSHIDETVQIERLTALTRGEFDLFYIAPERMKSKPFISALKHTDVNYLVVDEAHCASRWGHDFRPAYMNIRRILEFLDHAKRPRPSIIAVTATATSDIEDDIAKSVGMRDGYIRVVGDPVRPNLSYEVMRGYGWGNFRDVAADMDIAEGRHVIYAGTRKGAETLSQIVLDALEYDGVESRHVGVYHAGMKKEDRVQIQESFKSGATPIIIATNAFGMGIDVPNIRTVVHFGIPGSIEDYCQESGRAGRDGQSSRVILIDSDYNRELQQFFLDQSNPPYDLFRKVWEFLHTFPQGTVLRLSGREFAQEMGMRGDDRSMSNNAGAILGVLHTMDAYNVVDRQYMDAGTTVEGYYDDFLALRDTDMRRTARLVYDALAKILSHSKLAGDRRYKIQINKTKLATDLGISAYLVSKTLRTFEEVKVGVTYTGKTTQVLKDVYGKPLEDLIDESTIRAKRDRAQARLDAMIRYLGSPDKRRYIRDYFLCNVEDD